MKSTALPFVLVLATMLTACGDSGAPTEGSSPAAADERAASSSATDARARDEAAWTLATTGAEALEIDIEPRLGCVNDQIHILTMSQSPRFDLYLPASIDPGTYPLAQFDPNGEQAYVEGHSVVSLTGNVIPGSGSGYGTFYSVPKGGEVTIERMPSGPGEFFTATIRATLASRDDKTIELDADLNLQASGMMMMNCSF